MDTNNNSDSNTRRLALLMPALGEDQSTTTTTHFQIPYECQDHYTRVTFRCRDVHYRDNADEKHGLHLFLKGISEANPNLNEIVISQARNPELLNIIASYFLMQNRRHKIQKFRLHHCNLSVLFQQQFDFTNNSNIKNDENGNISDHGCTTEIYFRRCSFNNSASDVIYKCIENCSLFTSWHIDHEQYSQDILKGLQNNKHIHSLTISFVTTHILQRLGQINEDNDIIIDAITNIITHNNTTLTKLSLHWFNMHLFSTNAVSKFVDAVINSTTITDLSFHNLHFENVESFLTVKSILERKINIRKLQLDKSLLQYIDQSFDASSFSNLLQKNKYNDNILCELDIDLRLRNTNTDNQQISIFLTLLRDTHIEKLIIKLNELPINENMLKQLFLHTIPFMRKLRYFHCKNYFMNGLDVLGTDCVNSVGKCNRTLLQFETNLRVDEGNDAVRQYDKNTSIIKKYLKRNQQITYCIDNETKFNNYVYPKLFYIAKPTGTDAIYNLLNSIGLSIGPNNYNNEMDVDTVILKTKNDNNNNNNGKRCYK